MISLSTTITHTFAGGGSTSPTTTSGNSLLATNAELGDGVGGLWSDGNGNFYVGSYSYVYWINQSGYISGSYFSNVATNIQLRTNTYLAGDGHGNIYTSDYWAGCVRQILLVE